MHELKIYGVVLTVWIYLSDTSCITRRALILHHRQIPHHLTICRTATAPAVPAASAASRKARHHTPGRYSTSALAGRHRLDGNPNPFLSTTGYLGSVDISHQIHLETIWENCYQNPQNVGDGSPYRG